MRATLERGIRCVESRQTMSASRTTLSKTTSRVQICDLPYPEAAAPALRMLTGHNLMLDQDRHDLRELLSRLRPGVELHVQRAVLRLVFSDQGGESQELLEQRAIEFAQQNSCVFDYDARTQWGIFARAY
jgi:hypothetical protein